jgi:hypothetical protein
MSIAEQLQIEPCWRIAEGESDGQAVLIRLRCNIENAVAHASLGTCVQLTLLFPEDIDTTRLDEEQSGFLDEMENVFIDEVETDALGLCVLVYNMGRQVDYTYYVGELQPFIDFISNYQLEGVELSLGSDEEADWTSYRDMYQGIIDS